MKDKLFLMIPGPTPVPESVLQATAKHPIGHRSSEFSAILKQVFEDLKWFFQTKNDVFIFTASGTGAMDAALSNLINPGDKVLSLAIGNFGQRWAKIAKALGAEVDMIEVEPGKAINPADLKQKLDADVNKEIKIVILTSHNDTQEVLNSLKAGANAYCSKEINPKRLTEVVHSVLDGASWFDPSIAHIVLEAASNFSNNEVAIPEKDYGLTSRETQILKLITEGYSNNEIANQLFVSINTTKAHVASILQKLEVDDRLQAALKALKERLV